MSTPAAPPNVDSNDNRILSLVKVVQTDADSIAEAQTRNATICPREETSQSPREAQIIEPYRVSMYTFC